ncbi:hypothetical protein [Fibrobacter sp.]|uniref:hypothetical protein n=1 Tax=Fibrobacter sp. TaxID=35828 RepID=UPI00388F653B
MTKILTIFTSFRSGVPYGRASPYEVTQHYLTELLEKVKLFKESSKTRKSPMLTFVTSLGLKPNSCARQIPKSITLDVLYNSPNLP